MHHLLQKWYIHPSITRHQAGYSTSKCQLGEGSVYGGPQSITGLRNTDIDNHASTEQPWMGIHPELL